MIIKCILVAVAVGIIFFVGVAFGMSCNKDYYEYELNKERQETKKYQDYLAKAALERDRARYELASLKETNTDQPKGGQVTMKKTNFPDVPEGIWYEDFVKTVSDAGIMIGYDDGNFYPENNLKRCEAAKIIAMMLERIGEK